MITIEVCIDYYYFDPAKDYASVTLVETYCASC